MHAAQHAPPVPPPLPQAHSGNIPLGTVQRCHLLSVFASMLPESARLAHEAALLQRRHTRHMPPHILKQVRVCAYVCVLACAHEAVLLQRRHTRHMPPHILKQVRVCMCAYVHVEACTHMYMRTYMRAYTCTQCVTHARVHPRRC